jgi:hypothetical protein
MTAQGAVIEYLDSHSASQRSAPTYFPILESVQRNRQTLLVEHLYGFGLGQFIGRPPLFEKLDQR